MPGLFHRSKYQPFRIKSTSAPKEVISTPDIGCAMIMLFVWGWWWCLWWSLCVCVVIEKWFVWWPWCCFCDEHNVVSVMTMFVCGDTKMFVWSCFWWSRCLCDNHVVCVWWSRCMIMFFVWWSCFCYDHVVCVWWLRCLCDDHVCVMMMMFVCGDHSGHTVEARVSPPLCQQFSHASRAAFLPIITCFWWVITSWCCDYGVMSYDCLVLWLWCGDLWLLGGVIVVLWVMTSLCCNYGLVSYDFFVL